MLNDRFTSANYGLVQIAFPVMPDGSPVCRIDVAPGREVVHLNKTEVFIRDGNGTRKLEGPALTRWIQERAS